MRIAYLTVVGCFTLLLIGCGGSRPEDLIVGKWEGKEEKGGQTANITLDMAKDGKLKMSMAVGGKGLSVDGNYKLTDSGKKLEMTLAMPGKDMTKTMTVESLTRDRMVIYDPEDKTKTEFKRAS